MVKVEDLAAGVVVGLGFTWRRTYSIDSEVATAVFDGGGLGGGKMRGGESIGDGGGPCQSWWRRMWV